MNKMVDMGDTVNANNALKSDIEKIVIERLWKWTKIYKIPEDHGFGHYISVHIIAASANYTKIEPRTRLLILLAALLHDVDDRKLKKWITSLSLSSFPSQFSIKVKDNETKTDKKQSEYPIALSMLDGLGLLPAEIELILEMIELVSTSKNGNITISNEKDKWKLIPRDADRLEALGMIGVERCYQYTTSINSPLVLPDTPLPINEEELEIVMKGRTLDSYIKSGGTSSCMVQHYFDKLLLIHEMASGDIDLQMMANHRAKAAKNWLLNFCGTLRLLQISAPLYGKPYESLPNNFFTK